MKWLKRKIRSWIGINGDSLYPHRIVTMCYWRDGLIAVDGNGDIYELRPAFDDGQLYMQRIMRNPLEI